MPGGFSNGFSSGFGADAGTFRFLADHYIDNRIIRAGETRNMTATTWQPTADVDPIDATAINTFYFVGPQISGQIISRWTNEIIAPPRIYWYELTPGEWALKGLSAVTYPPIRANIGRIE